MHRPVEVKISNLLNGEFLASFTVFWEGAFEMQVISNGKPAPNPEKFLVQSSLCRESNGIIIYKCANQGINKCVNDYNECIYLDIKC
jgi:hypothetical protein